MNETEKQIENSFDSTNSLIWNKKFWNDIHSNETVTVISSILFTLTRVQYVPNFLQSGPLSLSLAILPSTDSKSRHVNTKGDTRNKI